MKAEYISTDPASRVEYAATGKADLILANFTVTEERAEQIDFALPYMKVKLHADYEATLAPVYGEAADPDNLVVEGGKIE